MTDEESPPAPESREPWFDAAFGPAYDRLYPHRNDEDAARDVERVLARNLSPEARTLDLCCGNGRHLEHLRAARFGRTVGLDRSAHLLSHARARLGESARLVRGDIRHLPFADGAFDAVFNFFTSFGYFEDDEEHEGVLREVVRVLAPAGVFHLDHIDREHLERTLVAHSEEQRGQTLVRIQRRLTDARVEKEITADDGSIDHHESVRVWRAEELRELAVRAGLRDVEVQPVNGRLHLWAGAPR